MDIGIIIIGWITTTSVVVALFVRIEHRLTAVETLIKVLMRRED